MKSIDPVAFQARLHREIPASQSLGVKIQALDFEHAIVSAPLTPNINHQQTAFGGSVHSVAVLACWSLLTGLIEIEDLKADYIVIQDSQIDYQKPVSTDFSARGLWESAEAREKFLTTLKKKGRARATLISRVSNESGHVCAELRARFAAQLIRY